jgi:chemotaxis protein MotB
VEGHTDNVPIRSSRFPTNWELSTARSTSVVAYLVTTFGFAPDRLTAAGYSQYRPVAPNETEAGRARNRRVDIIVLNGNPVLNP